MAYAEADAIRNRISWNQSSAGTPTAWVAAIAGAGSERRDLTELALRSMERAALADFLIFSDLRIKVNFRKRALRLRFFALAHSKHSPLAVYRRP
jgi:hypothetical protein